MNHKKLRRKLLKNKWKAARKNKNRVKLKIVKKIKPKRIKTIKTKLEKTTPSKPTSALSFTTKECSLTAVHPTKRPWSKSSRSNLVKNECDSSIPNSSTTGTASDTFSETYRKAITKFISKSTPKALTFTILLLSYIHQGK